MVMVLEAHDADTPAGRPFTPVDIPLLEIPVAPAVAWVMLVKAVLMHKTGVEEAVPTVFKLKDSHAPMVGVDALRIVPSYWEGIPVPVEPDKQTAGL